MQEIFREHVRRTAQVPHGWMSSRYGAGIVDTEALLSRPCKIHFKPSPSADLSFAAGYCR